MENQILHFKCIKGVPAERRASLESSVSNSGVHITCIVNEDGAWSLEMVSGLYTVFSFKLGVEHERRSHDGRQIKVIFHCFLVKD